MGLLGILAAAAVNPRFIRHILLAVALPDVVPRFAHRGIRDIHAVGTHIGDQADRTLAAHVQPLVQLLRHRHGALGSEPELAPRILLQGAGDEGRGRPLATWFLLHAVHGVGSPLEFGFQAPRGVLVADGQFARPLAGMQGGREQVGPVRRVGVLVQFGFQGPPFLGHERGDGPLTFHNHPQGDGLHPAGRQSQFHLQPEQRADLIPHQPVQDATGLLGVDQLHIDFARMIESVLDGLFSDLVEDDAFGWPLELVPAGGRLQVPGDSLALPVRVGGQEDIGCLGAGFFETFDQIALVAQGEILWREFSFGINAQR